MKLLVQNFPSNGSFPEGLVSSTATKPPVTAIPFVWSIQS